MCVSGTSGEYLELLSTKEGTDLVSVLYRKVICLYGKVNHTFYTFLFLFSNTMLVIRAEIYQKLVIIANREYPNHITQFDLVCPVCLFVFSRPLAFKILEYLP